MFVNAFYSSRSTSCGISIFSRHLTQALSPYGINVIETNIRQRRPTAPSPISLLHYLPSGFITSDELNALDLLLNSFNSDEKLCVILHGAHAHGETRFQQDGISPGAERHIRFLLRRANLIVGLSESVTEAWRTWRGKSGYQGKFLRINHPGLFKPLSHQARHGAYAFLGGISRPKKDYASGRIRTLVKKCEDLGIGIWQHWSNVSYPNVCPTSWRHSFGLIGDDEWATLISEAKAVLCPYHTRIQSVSGLISEALSAQRFVLATSFDIAREMQRRVPSLVYVEDDLERWPEILRKLSFSPQGHKYPAPPTWESFARQIALELSRMTRQENCVSHATSEAARIQNNSTGEAVSLSATEL